MPALLHEDGSDCVQFETQLTHTDNAIIHSIYIYPLPMDSRNRILHFYSDQF